MKTKVFILFVLASFLFSGCIKQHANVERIGAGCIRNDGGNLVVEIGSVKYFPDVVYANSQDGSRRQRYALDGMLVTVFRMRGNSEVTFIVGNQSEAYLEEYFTEDFTFPILLMFLVVFCFGGLGIIFSVPLLDSKRKSVKRSKNIKKREQ